MARNRNEEEPVMEDEVLDEEEEVVTPVEEPVEEMPEGEEEIPAEEAGSQISASTDEVPELMDLSIGDTITFRVSDETEGVYQLEAIPEEIAEEETVVEGEEEGLSPLTQSLT